MRIVLRSMRRILVAASGPSLLPAAGSTPHATVLNGCLGLVNRNYRRAAKLPILRTPSNSRRAAINHHCLSGRKGTRFGRKEHGHARNLVWLTDPFDTLARGLGFEDRRIFP